MTGDELRKWRNDFGVSASLFAKLLAMGNGTIGRYETGKSPMIPVVYTLMQVIRANPLVLYDFFEQRIDVFTEIEKDIIAEALSRVSEGKMGTGGTLKWKRRGGMKKDG